MTQSAPPAMTQSYDPSGLIRESYRIEGITIYECRSIFLDWAMKLPADIVPATAIRALLGVYSDKPDHPMTHVLTEGLGTAGRSGRRGGAAARRP